MRKFIFFIILIVAQFGNSQAINQKDASGKRHGVWKKNFEGTEVIRYQGEFNHGQEIGTFKFYKNINGKPVLTATRSYLPNSDLAEVTFFASTKKLAKVRESSIGSPG